MTESATQTTVVKEETPLYCAICSFPPEYCQYGSRLSKCKAWLSDKHSDLFASLYGSTSAVPAAASTAEPKEGETGLEPKLAESSLDKEARKKEAKAIAKEEKEEKKRLNSKVLIKRIERNKRKYVTAIHGLEVFEIDLKKAAKLFANKFAASASVSKNNQGEDEIVVQGDVADEVEEMLQDKTPKIAAILGGGKVPEDNVEIVEDKKKKAPA